MNKIFKKDEIIPHHLLVKEDLTNQAKNFIENSFLGLIITKKISDDIIFEKYYRKQLKRSYFISGFSTPIHVFNLKPLLSDGKKIKINFEEYQLKFHQGEYTNVNFIFLEHPNMEIADLIFNKLEFFIKEFDRKYVEILKNLDKFNLPEEIENLIQEIIFEKK